MAEQIQLDFRIAARVRWGSGLEISGAGSWAVIFRCRYPHFVRLFETRTEAFNISKQSWGSNCKNAHGWIQLQLPAPKAQVRAHWHGEVEE